MLSVCFSNQACFLSVPDSLHGRNVELHCSCFKMCFINYRLIWLVLQSNINKKKNANNKQEAFIWTDDEVELLLRVTNDYKVSKSFESIDWESIQSKYGDILERFKQQYPAAETNSSGKDFIVFKSIRFRVSTLIRYVCVFICIHFQQCFQIDAFSVNTLSVFERISVDGRPKRIEMYAFSNVGLSLYVS